jgi:hypothetical protein
MSQLKNPALTLITPGRKVAGGESRPGSAACGPSAVRSPAPATPFSSEPTGAGTTADDQITPAYVAAPEAILARAPEAIPARAPEAIAARAPEAIPARAPEALAARAPEAVPARAAGPPAAARGPQRSSPGT